MSDNEKLIGVWKLVSNEHILSSGAIEQHYGKKPKGILIYAKPNVISVMFGATDRKKFKHNRLLDGMIDEKEKANAIETFLAYSGTFEVQKNEVLHHVEISLFPNWVGSIQKRFWELRDDQLTLTTPKFVSNDQEQFAKLVWKKIS